MKQLIFLVGCFFFASLTFGQTDESADFEWEEPGYEKILHYHSDITVLKNCHVRVKERIVVYAEGIRIQRGIYRDLPTSYAYKGGNVHMGFELLGVKKKWCARALQCGSHGQWSAYLYR